MNKDSFYDYENDMNGWVVMKIDNDEGISVIRTRYVKQKNG